MSLRQLCWSGWVTASSLLLAIRMFWPSGSSMRDHLKGSLAFLTQVAPPKTVCHLLSSKSDSVGIKDIKCGLTQIPCLVFLCCTSATLWLHRVWLLGLHPLWLLLHCPVGLCVPPNTWWDHHEQLLTPRGTLPHECIKTHSVLSKRPPKKTSPRDHLLLWVCSLFHSHFPLSSAFSKALLTCLSLNIDFV